MVIGYHPYSQPPLSFKGCQETCEFLGGFLILYLTAKEVMEISPQTPQGHI